MATAISITKSPDILRIGVKKGNVKSKPMFTTTDYTIKHLQLNGVIEKNGRLIASPCQM